MNSENDLNEVVSSLSMFKPDQLCEKHRAEFDKQQERLKTQCSWCESRKAKTDINIADVALHLLMLAGLCTMVFCVVLFAFYILGPQ
jgi:hypothetical protein